MKCVQGCSGRRLCLLSLLVSGGVTSIAMLAAVLFFRNLGKIVAFCGSCFGLSGDLAAYVADVFATLQQAKIRPPLAFLTAALLMGWGLLTGIKKRRNRGIAAVIFLVVLTLLVIWYTRVNSIRFGNVASSLLRLMAAGVF